MKRHSYLIVLLLPVLLTTCDEFQSINLSFQDQKIIDTLIIGPFSLSSDSMNNFYWDQSQKWSLDSFKPMIEEKSGQVFDKNKLTEVKLKSITLKVISPESLDTLFTQYYYTRAKLYITSANNYISLRPDLKYNDIFWNYQGLTWGAAFGKELANGSYGTYYTVGGNGKTRSYLTFEPTLDMDLSSYLKDDFFRWRMTVQSGARSTRCL
ncbi:MAG: hypothetical protein GC181_16305 [Bacteroidetes bacterium]|nr:hypothetical protein [Bacteroidota bacterium]